MFELNEALKLCKYLSMQGVRYASMVVVRPLGTLKRQEIKKIQIFYRNTKN
jgi:hypothetical protein